MEQNVDDDDLVSGNDAFKQRGGDEGREAVHSPVSALRRKKIAIMDNCDET